MARDNSRGSLLLSTFFGVLASIILIEFLALYWDRLSKLAILLIALVIGVSIGFMLACWLLELSSRWKNQN